MFITNREIMAVDIMIRRMEVESASLHNNEAMSNSLVVLRLCFTISLSHDKFVEKAKKYLSQKSLDLLLDYIDVYQQGDTPGKAVWIDDLIELWTKLISIRSQLNLSSVFLKPKQTLYLADVDIMRIYRGLSILESSIMIDEPLYDQRVSKLFEKPLKEEQDQIKLLKKRVIELNRLLLDEIYQNLKNNERLNVLYDMDLIIQGLHKLEQEVYENGDPIDSSTLEKIIILRSWFL